MHSPQHTLKFKNKKKIIIIFNYKHKFVLFIILYYMLYFKYLSAADNWLDKYLISLRRCNAYNIVGVPFND